MTKKDDATELVRLIRGKADQAEIDQAWVEAGRRYATINGTSNPSVVGAARTRNNGRYNGNGREWATPPEIFDPLHEEFRFTLDVAASQSNTKCLQFFTEAEDGLSLPWTGERVWMNPPYGREIYAWTRKARIESERAEVIVGLLPASTDLAWWHEDVLPYAASVRYLRGRVRFLTDGPYRASGFFPSVVVVWNRHRCELVPDGAEAERAVTPAASEAP